MSAAEAYVSEASGWAKSLVKATGLSVKQDPYAVVARRLGKDVPASRIYSLTRRPNSMKEVGAHIHAALRAAYAAECARQAEKFTDEANAAIQAGADPAVIRSIARLAGIEVSEADR